MATLKLYLDMRSPRRDGRCAIRLQINHRGRTAMVNTSLAVLPEEWDERRCLVNSRHYNFRAYNNRLLKMLADYEETLLNLINAGEIHNVSASDIRSKIEAVLHPAKSVVTLRSMIERCVESKSNLSTRQTYSILLAHFVPILDMLVADIDTGRIQAEFDRISESCGARTLVLFKSRLSSVFNRAVDEELLRKNPVRGVKIESPAVKHRDVSIDMMRTILLDRDRNVGNDMFALSFYLCGANPVDLLKMDKPVNGRVEYYRSKTKKFYSIKVVPEAQAIIDRYADDEKLLNLHRTFKDNHALNFRISKDLKRYEGAVMYSARHSFATIAAEIGVPVDDISLCLGHALPMKVTSIYINPSLGRIDAAQRRVIDYVLHQNM